MRISDGGGAAFNPRVHTETHPPDAPKPDDRAAEPDDRAAENDRELADNGQLIKEE